MQTDKANDGWFASVEGRRKGDKVAAKHKQYTHQSSSGGFGKKSCYPHAEDIQSNESEKPENQQKEKGGIWVQCLCYTSQSNGGNKMEEEIRNEP